MKTVTVQRKKSKVDLTHPADVFRNLLIELELQFLLDRNILYQKSSGRVMQTDNQISRIVRQIFRNPRRKPDFRPVKRPFQRNRFSERIPFVSLLCEQGKHNAVHRMLFLSDVLSLYLCAEGVEFARTGGKPESRRRVAVRFCIFEPHAAVADSGSAFQTPPDICGSLLRPKSAGGSEER